MESLRAMRESLGLSQRALARRAGLAYKTLQLLESGRHDPRWSTLAKIARVIGAAPADLAERLGPLPGPRGLTARNCAARLAREGPERWKGPLLEFVDDWRRDPLPSRVMEAPNPGPRAALLALLACTVEALCAEARLPAPWWCAGVPPLSDPWFVADSENLKASALVESPAAFRQRNIFVLRNFLSRA